MANLLSAKELKKQGSLVDLLNRLGYQPVPKQGREKMYHSMLRENDTKPSLSVNDALGVWFDHGTGKGGNIIDFGLAYWKTLGFNAVVEKIQSVLSLEPGRPRIICPPKMVKVSRQVVEQVNPIGTRPAITEYLKGRGIFEVAQNYLSEVNYYWEDGKNKRRYYFAAGWQNEHQSWEVRSRYFKGSLGDKGITFIPGHNKNSAIFEGFFDFLSWRIENKEAEHSVIVLNTLSLLKTGISKAKAFSSVDTYFDRDSAGTIATKELIKALPYATDRSYVYEGFNDYNDKIMARLNDIAIENKKASDFFFNVKVPFKR